MSDRTMTSTTVEDIITKTREWIRATDAMFAADAQVEEIGAVVAATGGNARAREDMDKLRKRGERANRKSMRIHKEIVALRRKAAREARDGSPVIAGGGPELDGEDERERLTTRERRENRAERRRDWQESRERKTAQAVKAFEAAREQVPPMGEPIKVGHHSEGRHRKSIERVDRKLEQMVEHDRMAKRHGGRAANLERELDRSIYSDDEDAIERLEERIAELEARRERMKTINRIVRAALKRGGGKLMPGAFDELGLSTKERADLLSAAGNTFEPFKGYPSYALSNLGGNISRQRQRLARLQAAAA